MMYDEKDPLFDLFRAQEQTLDEMPPDTAWQELDQKLQQKRKKSQARRPRLEVPMYIIVLILLLLLITGGAAVYITKLAKERQEQRQ